MMMKAETNLITAAKCLGYKRTGRVNTALPTVPEYCRQ